MEEEDKKMKECPDCKNKVINEAVYCTTCGHKFDESKIKPEPQPKKKTPIIGILAVLLVVGVVAIIGLAYVYSSGTIDVKPPDDAYVPYVPPAPIVSYDDAEYVIWQGNILDDVSTDCEMISLYAGSYNFNGVETWSKMLENDCSDALDEIDDYDVSSKYYNVQRQFKFALEDYEMAGYWGYMGAKYTDADYLDMAVDYMEDGTEHINIAILYLE